ncbi:MAG TPA: methyltransferase domain-containing protein [Pyrinomonadaceae bacterium]|jgi:ubiquinone/menaquinone biosynthesis C-methylase UbiE
MSRPLSTYDDIAPHYDEAMCRLERWFFPGLREEALARLPDDSRILEVGAGTGLNFVLYPPGASGFATEPNAEMLKLARAKQTKQITLIQNCAEQLPFADASFDAAIATLVFCSVSSPESAFQELRRVVRKGGRVILLEHVRPKGLLGPIFDVLNLLTVPLFDDHFNRRTAETARSAGFNLIEVQKRAGGIVNLISCEV